MPKKKRNLRDYGYGPSPKVKGAPIVGDRVTEEPCPHCGCTALFHIKVELEDKDMRLLHRPKVPHRIVGNYIGCPACPWASPMMISAEELPS